MKTLKRIICTILALFLLAPSLFACGSEEQKSGGGNATLIVYNWADFIDENLLTEFSKYYKTLTGDTITINYQTYDTPDTMYAQIKSGNKWHLGINSDYLTGKLWREDRLQPFPVEEMPNYLANVSDWSKSQYQTIQRDFGYDGDEVFGIGYMWGTMGIVYNTSILEHDTLSKEEVFADLFKDWGLMWNNKFKNKVFMKNSIRETSIVGMLHGYNEQLREARSQMSADDYGKFLYETLNSPIDNAKIEIIKNTLIDQQKQVNVMYDVDFDKNAMASGVGVLDYCWAGDGFYAMQMAAENGIELSYAVPETGTNLFFDGFFLNKDLEKDSLLYKASIAFVEFLCDSENAVANMDYIGYTSAVATMDMLDYVHNSWQDAIDSESDMFCVSDQRLIEKAENADVAYFFSQELLDEFYDQNGYYPILNPIQYPGIDEMFKFSVVRTFTLEENEALLKMWAEVKVGALPIIQIIIFAVLLAGALGLAAFKLISAQRTRQNAKVGIKKPSKRLC